MRLWPMDENESSGSGSGSDATEAAREAERGRPVPVKRPLRVDTALEVPGLGGDDAERLDREEHTEGAPCSDECEVEGR